MKEPPTPKWLDVLLAVLRIVVVIGCVLVAAFFILMLLFPAYGGSDGWIGLFK